MKYPPTDASSGGAAVSAAPTKQAVVLPQIAQIYTDVGGYGILPYPRSP
ncbi:hypothetical protein [Leyella stercorea]